MESLKNKLNNLIQQRGSISRREILEMCDSGYFGRKYELSNAERRIRQSPDIEALDEDGKPARATNKAIKTYVWRGLAIPPEKRPVKEFKWDAERNVMIAFIN